MDNRPVGVFDSGLGGLTAVRQLRSQLPGEDIIYFGDTARVPYGGRSKSTLMKYARQDIRFLLQYDIKAVVVACNTADTVRKLVAPEFSVPILGTVEPSAAAAAAATRNGRIGLIGTKATIGSKVYEQAILRENPNAEVRAVACPLLVPMVENGRTQPGDLVIETIVREYLQPLRDWNCDTLVLGCTHYPLLMDVIGNFMGSGTTLINSGAEAAKALAGELASRQLLSKPGRQGTSHYYVSDSVDDFMELASQFLCCSLDGAVERVEIEKY